MASWNNQSQPSGGRPTANPLGGSLTKDDIQLKRLTPKDTDASALIKSAFELIKTNPLETAVLPIGIMIVFSIIQQIFSIPLNLLASYVGQAGGGALGGEMGQLFASLVIFGVQITVSIIAQFAITVAMGGVFILWLKIIRGQSFEISDIKAVKSFAIPLIVTSFLAQLAVGFGLVFLIVPGVIIAMGFAMTSYIIIDKNLRYIDALKASWELMDGHKMEFFIFSIIMFFLNLAGVLACCVGWVITIPLSFGATLSFYDAIAEPGNAYGNNLGNAPDVFS